jgi:predicted TIM-barrel fold metal-dependent hydrolase
MILRRLLLSILPLSFVLGTVAEARQPIVDAHTHYSWNQYETLPPEEAIRLLKANGVVMVVVASTPPELALKLWEVDGDMVVPIFSPYLTPAHRNNWFNQPEVLELMEQGLASGKYKGIGEVHLIPGLGPRRDDPAFLQTLELAREYEVPYLIHTDASSYKYLLPVCQEHDDIQFVWAHAGGILPPEQVDALLEGCPNTVIDLSARDPLRYVETPITDQDGHLLPGWRDLVIKHPKRVLVGADALWPVIQKNAWDAPDTGWQMLGDFLDFHRTWVSDLPEEIQEDILVNNARRIFRPTY